jgi:hypothetical protein
LDRPLYDGDGRNHSDCFNCTGDQAVAKEAKERKELAKELTAAEREKADEGIEAEREKLAAAMSFGTELKLGEKWKRRLCKAAC